MNARALEELLTFARQPAKKAKSPFGSDFAQALLPGMLAKKETKVVLCALPLLPMQASLRRAGAKSQRQRQQAMAQQPQFLRSPSERDCVSPEQQSG